MSPEIQKRDIESDLNKLQVDVAERRKRIASASPNVPRMVNYEWGQKSQTQATCQSGINSSESETNNSKNSVATNGLSAALSGNESESKPQSVVGHWFSHRDLTFQNFRDCLLAFAGTMLVRTKKEYDTATQTVRNRDLSAAAKVQILNNVWRTDDVLFLNNITSDHIVDCSQTVLSIDDKVRLYAIVRELQILKAKTTDEI